MGLGQDDGKFEVRVLSIAVSLPVDVELLLALLFTADVHGVFSKFPGQGRRAARIEQRLL